MLRSAAVTQIYRGLSFRNSSTKLDNAIIDALQQAQSDLEQGATLPTWIITYDDTSIAGVAGVNNAALPASFLREVEDEPLFLLDEDGNETYELERGEYNQLRSVWRGITSRSTPYAYARRSNEIVVFPTPNVDWTLKWGFYAKQTLLDNDVENAWLKNVPYLMIAMAGLKVAADLQDVAATAKFQALFNRHNGKYLADIVVDEMAGRTFIMGGNN